MRDVRTLILALPLLLLAIAGCADAATEDADDASAATSDAMADDEQRDYAGSNELSIANGYLPGSLDPTQEGFNLVERGIGETLTRIGADLSVEMRLAESMEMVDETTWEISLREGVTFWDGVELTADHVAASFERAWDQQPAADRFVSADTEIDVVDEHTLRMRLPEPVATLPNNLAAFQLLIYREDGDEPIMTGPYQPIELATGEHLIVEAYEDYWDGTPAVDRMTFRLMADGNARMIAVQSGDVDISMQAPPEEASAASGDVEAVTVASSRVHYVILNHKQAPFDDPAVREAMNLAVDRDELNEVALGGLGLPISSMIPPDLGFSTPDQIETDPDGAAEILEDAGWEMSDDGVRVRDDEPLELTIKSYPFRPELTTMAVSIQDQLGRIGFDVAVQEFDDIIAEIEDGDFQASMFSVEMLPTGDPHYALNTNVWSEAIYNYGGYESDELDDLLDRIQREVDHDRRDQLLSDAQDIVRDDSAMVFLVAAPRPVVYRPDRVQAPELHPSDMYFVDLEQPSPAGSDQ